MPSLTEGGGGDWLSKNATKIVVMILFAVSSWYFKGLNEGLKAQSAAQVKSSTAQADSIHELTLEIRDLGKVIQKVQDTTPTLEEFTDLRIDLAETMQRHEALRSQFDIHRDFCEQWHTAIGGRLLPSQPGGP